MLVVILCIISTFDIVFFSVIFFDYCNARPEKASKYTEQEHLQRISDRIEKHYVEINNYPIYDFEVFPVYDINDEFKYALVEFKPYGYVYVYITDERNSSSDKRKFKEFGHSTCMYFLSTIQYEIEDPWSPSYVEDEKIKFKEEEYYNSPFSVNNIENEKRYLISVDPLRSVYLVPAVKRNGKYINLYSNDEFTLENGSPTTKQAVSKTLYFSGFYFNFLEA